MLRTCGPQLLHADEINENRMATWNAYRQAFAPLAQAGKVELQTLPEGCEHNAHMFYIKCKDLAERTALIDYLKQNGILAVFHYIPLHIGTGRPQVRPFRRGRPLHHQGE